MTWFNTRSVTLATLAAVATALVLGAVVLLARGDSNAPIQVVLPTVTADAAGVNALSGGGTRELQVYVSGAVNNPGVYELRSGDRLVEALEAAGGATGDADLSALNLALRVRDEGHYHVPKLGEVVSRSGPGPSVPQLSTGSTTTDALIDLNNASVELLDTLPGIGPSLANAIVTYREANGPFRSTEEVTNVPRIGPVTYERIRNLITVGGEQ